MNHAVHAADIDKRAVGGQGLDNAGIVLADLDFAPDLLLSGLALLGSDGTDGADHTAAVDLGNTELDLALDERAQIAALGNVGLGSGNEHADALHIDDNAALVLFGDNAFHDLAALNGSLDLFPSLACFQTLLGQTDNTLAVVDVNDNSLDLIADLDKILDLGAGICGGELLHGNVSGVLRAEIDFDLIGADRHDGAGDLIPVIQSLEGLLEKLGKILLHCSFNFHFFAHFVVYLLNYPRRS